MRITPKDLGRWIAACAAGELVGIGFGALAGHLVAPLMLGTPSVGSKAVLLGAAASIGVVEGGALGALQGTVLRRRLPRLRVGEWAMPTALFATLGWLGGMLGPILGQGESGGDAGGGPSLGIVLGLAAVVGAAAGALLGLVQWLVLRRHAAGAGRWIPANALGWALAMPAIFAGFGAPADDASPALRLASSALGGLAAGLLLGVATAPVAARLAPWVREDAALAGKTAVVTGATSGIGFEVALGLARLGARTILVGRDATKLARAEAEVRRRVANPVLESVVCDLSRGASVERAARVLCDRAAKVDLLVHDAGAIFDRLTVTDEGTEATLAVDVLGPARLTEALGDRLARGARVVVLTGIYQRRGVIDRADLHFARRPYSMAVANAQAQRMRLAWVASLARRRPDVFVAAVHPGAVRTAAIERAPAWARVLAATLARPAFARAELGALTVLRFLTAADVPSGRFWDRFRVTADVPTRDEIAALDEACGAPAFPLPSVA